MLPKKRKKKYREFLAETRAKEEARSRQVDNIDEIEIRKEIKGYYKTEMQGYELFYPFEPYSVQLKYSSKVIEAI